MTLTAFEGPAGCGKTTQLIEALRAALVAAPLQEGQRVLALTFMHGARRRLNEKLRGIEGLRGRTECMTVDSFAQRLVRRWRGLAVELAIPPFQPHQYDAYCDAAGMLLERPEVRRWVASSFPVILVDEAQDLRPEKVRMVAALTDAVTLIVAADDFQCLDQALRPNPGVTWLRATCEPLVLANNHRTDIPALLAAAATIRQGGAPIAGPRFQILSALGLPSAAAYLANAIAWRNGGNVAVLTPSLAGGYVQAVVARVGQQACGAQGNGPYSIRWENSESEEVAALMAGIELPQNMTLGQAIDALGGLAPSGIVRQAAGFLKHRASTTGATEFSREEVLATVTRQVQIRRQRFSAPDATFSAMTVQQAKNREFDGVVVIWPFTVGGDAEQKRRLLYNAITRAKRWCTVVLQNDDLRNVAPFA